jgi:hypothetical protein
MVAQQDAWATVALTPRQLIVPEGLMRVPGTKCREWRQKKRSVPEGQDDCVGAAVESITESSTCQATIVQSLRDKEDKPRLS